MYILVPTYIVLCTCFLKASVPVYDVQLCLCRRNIKSLDATQNQNRTLYFAPASVPTIDRPTTKLKPNYRPVLLLSYFSHSYQVNFPLLGSLFRNKRIMLDEMLQRNASKFAILLGYEKYMGGCRIPKIWQILKRFTGAFHQA